MPRNRLRSNPSTREFNIADQLLTTYLNSKHKNDEGSCNFDLLYDTFINQSVHSDLRRHIMDALNEIDNKYIKLMNYIMGYIPIPTLVPTEQHVDALRQENVSQSPALRIPTVAEVQETRRTNSSPFVAYIPINDEETTRSPELSAPTLSEPTREIMSDILIRNPIQEENTRTWGGDIGPISNVDEAMSGPLTEIMDRHYTISNHSLNDARMWDVTPIVNRGVTGAERDVEDTPEPSLDPLRNIRLPRVRETVRSEQSQEFIPGITGGFLP